MRTRPTTQVNEDLLPRERLARVGVRALADRELLALVLGHGMAGRSALEIATAILGEVGSVHGLTKVSRSRLAMEPGVGTAQASRIIAAIELGRRTLVTSPPAKLPLQTAAELGQFLLPRFGAHPVERFGVVLLDARHRFLSVHLVSEGSLTATAVLARDVFREATIGDAAAVALFHNHPSGDPTPTRPDVMLTRRFCEAGETLGIEVVDHLILADDRYCSMRQLRLI